ncbi:hypothetical protein [uncultured Desulfobacter sp.]|uniref:hypothetical protein n=1 Tax=uncultured Desulfobacter sp. TaxID=240139 RepID=UPI002AA88A87|nr:hypothetical protein [uncultured Desulfobacter sp.]
MSAERIAGKPIEQWHKALPLIKEIIAGKEVFWTNPGYRSAGTAFKSRLMLRIRVV